MAYRSKNKTEVDRKYYLQNKEKRLSLTREYRRKHKEWFEEYKSTLECRQCGFKGHGVAFDFHHPNKDKEFNISNLAGQTSNKERILKEIEKCTVLCSNCHRIHHWNERRTSS